MNRGDRLTLTIERPAAGGRMIARHDGAIFFVAGAIPGEVVEAEVEKVQRGTGWAITRTVVERSPDRAPDAADGTWRMAQSDVDRVQEFRKCIECFLCQDVCHVLRDHKKHDEFIGPRYLTFAAALEMHPLDTVDRTEELKDMHGIGYCNITKCCTKVCPEGITITDNAIIPLKERVVDQHYDPLHALVRIFRRKSQ